MDDAGDNAIENALSHAFARRLGALAATLGASPATVRRLRIAASAISRATADGHVCIALATLAQRIGEPLDTLRAALLDSGLAGRGNVARSALLPLVIDDDDRLYLARYYAFERDLAQSLAARMRADDGDGGGTQARVNATADSGARAADALRVRLERFFEPSDDAQIDWQRVAAALALTSRLTIVSGGPGTGKTTTVVGILACLIDANPALRVALAAPTGKAAQRMQEALTERAGRLPPEIAARLPDTSFTLHRLLGSGPGGPFRHHRGRPLPYDVVVIDEASMIDVALAASLVEAVAPTAKLIMLGDKDQLAAVEAGAVFAELSASPALSDVKRRMIAHAMGVTEAALRDALPAPADAVRAEARSDGRIDAGSYNGNDGVQAWLEAADVEIGEDRVAPSFVVARRAPPDAPVQGDLFAALDDPRSQRNYRFGLDSPIGRLSIAIRRGLAGAALDALGPRAVPDSDTRHDAAVLFDDAGVTLSEASRQWLCMGFAAYADALATVLRQRDPDPSPLFDALQRFRVLCAVRAGPRGVDALNALLAADVRRRAQVTAPLSAQWFAGRPVMVTRNDYALGLFNGDVGIALPGPQGALRVFFPTAEHGYRAVSALALPPHDTAFALTVHKSQGSEFDCAALVMPAAFSRVLSRELLYTAVTRARARVAVFGASTVFAQAVALPTRRDSGLKARLREAFGSGAL
jgi:exodeoxyribonuclease V alpha subunit